MENTLWVDIYAHVIAPLLWRAENFTLNFKTIHFYRKGVMSEKAEAFEFWILCFTSNPGWLIVCLGCPVEKWENDQPLSVRTKVLPLICSEIHYLMIHGRYQSNEWESRKPRGTVGRCDKGDTLLVGNHFSKYVI